MSRSPENDGYKVGPGNPPREHRWKKGQPSPNPRGRPPKKPQEKLLTQLNKMQQAVLAHANKEITIRGADGERTISQLEAFLDTLLKNAAKNGQTAIQTYYAAIREAMAADASFKSELLDYALQHRARWLEIFIQAEEQGKEVPGILPDPRDIEILPDGTVKIVGPISYEQQRLVEEILNELDTYQSVWNEVGNATALPFDDRMQIWRKICRRMRQLNKGLSPRLKRCLPPKPV